MNNLFVPSFFLLIAQLLFVSYSPLVTAQTELSGAPGQQQATTAPAFSQRDGSHDFDFLIGDWKAHARALRNRLDDSKNPKEWVDQEGISNHKKLLDSNANFEDFDAYGVQLHRRNKGQTLRLYNPETHQWSIYLLDVDKGTIDLPPVIGQFTGNRGEFYNQDTYKGRPIFVRYVWLNISPKSARMEQSWSADGGKTWEVNWICELSR